MSLRKNFEEHILEEQRCYLNILKTDKTNSFCKCKTYYSNTQQIFINDYYLNCECIFSICNRDCITIKNMILNDISKMIINKLKLNLSPDVFLHTLSFLHIQEQIRILKIEDYILMYKNYIDCINKSNNFNINEESKGENSDDMLYSAFQLNILNKYIILYKYFEQISYIISPSTDSFFKPIRLSRSSRINPFYESIKCNYRYFGNSFIEKSMLESYSELTVEIFKNPFIDKIVNMFLSRWEDDSIEPSIYNDSHTITYIKLPPQYLCWCLMINTPDISMELSHKLKWSSSYHDDPEVINYIDNINQNHNPENKKYGKRIKIYKCDCNNICCCNDINYENNNEHHPNCERRREY